MFLTRHHPLFEIFQQIYLMFQKKRGIILKLDKQHSFEKDDVNCCLHIVAQISTCSQKLTENFDLWS